MRKTIHANSSTFVNVNDGHRKFWGITIDIANRRVTIKWGRIGSLGQRKLLRFDDRATLRAYADAKLREKINHGYAQVA